MRAVVSGRLRVTSTHIATVKSTSSAVVRSSTMSESTISAAAAYAAKVAVAATTPVGNGEAGDSPHEPRAVPLRVRGESQEEGGDADRQAGDDRQVPGIEGERHVHDADRHREHEGVDGLRDEQPGDPLDVRDDPAALAEHGRQRREGVVEQHDLRHGP